MGKLRESARGQECMVRQPCVCSYDPSTTVLAHINGGGMGMKQPDLFGAFCCSECHWWLDGGYAQQGFGRAARDLAHLEAVIRTQAWWLKNGYISLTPSKE
jgi:hypothetical protein